MYRSAITAALVLLFVSTAAVAQQVGVVEGLQAPAWIERQGALSPVAPGMALRQQDRLRTGDGGRLLLRLAEGSHVKLGANARFELERLEPPAQDDGPFSGLLKVAKGAFRFTTSLLSRPHRRHLDIQVAAVTAGIRGTDLWGKAKPDEDIVCLIDGTITVSRGDDAPLTMDEPLSFYIAPKGAPAKPVARVDEDQLAQWAAETELTAGEGVMVPGGDWTLSLASFRQRERAGRALRRLHADGIPVEMVEVTVDGEPWYRLVARGFRARGEAMALARRPEVRDRHPGAWAYLD